MRTTKATITFNNPFRLEDSGDVLPPGNYEMETDEELIEGVSFPAYRRVRTVLHIKEPVTRPIYRRLITVDPDDLSQALQRDKEIENSREHALLGNGARLAKEKSTMADDLRPPPDLPSKDITR